MSLWPPKNPIPDPPIKEEASGIFEGCCQTTDRRPEPPIPTFIYDVHLDWHDRGDCHSKYMTIAGRNMEDVIRCIGNELPSEITSRLDIHIGATDGVILKSGTR